MYPILDESLPLINLLALNENGPEPIEANEFAPFFSKTLLEDIEATTFDYEIVKKKWCAKIAFDNRKCDLLG